MAVTKHGMTVPARTSLGAGRITAAKGNLGAQLRGDELGEKDFGKMDETISSPDLGK